MELTEYILLFVFVIILGAGIPGPGDASLIAAGTLAGEDRLDVWVVVVTAAVAWLLGSAAGYRIGLRGGRGLLDRPGILATSRQKLLAKGDRVFGRHNFTASVTMPAFVSGVFRVRFPLFMLGAVVAGTFWIGMYVGLSYLFGEEVAKRIGDVGAKLVLGVIVAVVIGLGLRAGWSRWRARQGRQVGGTPVRAEQSPSVAPPAGDRAEP